jgi:hypothetical protein
MKKQAAIALMGCGAEIEQLPRAAALPVADFFGSPPHRAGIECTRAPQGI